MKNFYLSVETIQHLVHLQKGYRGDVLFINIVTSIMVAEVANVSDSLSSFSSSIVFNTSRRPLKDCVSITDDVIEQERGGLLS